MLALIFADEGGHEFSTLHREYSTTTILECTGNEASIASCRSLTVEEATCHFLLVNCQNNEKTNDDPNGDNSDEGIDSTSDGINSNETSVIGVGDGRDKGEDSDSGEDGDFGEGGDNDSGDNKDPTGDKTGAVSGGGGGADDGNKNGGSDRDVLSSGSGSNPTVDIIEEKTSVPPEVRPTAGQSHTLSVVVFSAITTSVVVVLFLVSVMVFLLVYVKRRRRRAAASAQVSDSTNQNKGEGVGERGGGGGEKHLDNPVYDASMESPNNSQGAEITEHSVVNPLYDTNSDATDARLYAVLEAPNYAVLEGPNYAMPGQVFPPCSATETLSIDDGHNYDYADIPDGKTNVV